MERKISEYKNGEITLIVYEATREAAWAAITNIGATVKSCNQWHDGGVFAVGTMKGDLIQIEALERAGWEMEGWRRPMDHEDLPTMQNE